MLTHRGRRRTEQTDESALLGKDAYHLKTALKVLLIVVLVLLLAAAGIVWYAVSKIQDRAVGTTERPDHLEVIDGNRDESLEPSTTKPDSQAEDPGESEEDGPYEEQLIYEVDRKDADVVNILLIGTDSRSGSKEATGRSDSMMLVSYNSRTKTVKLISLMRDSWVKINGTRWGRLNTAYNSGGPGSLINTVNLCFDLDVQYYAAISFSVFEELIDQIGGVTVDLTKREASFINGKVGRRVLEPKDGPVLLDGELALWYARCRADSDGDFSRTARQRHLVELLYQSMKTDANLQKLSGIASYAVENVTTNLTLDMMIQLGTSVLTSDISMESHHLPFDDTWHYAEKNGASVLSVDLEANAAELNRILYGE